MLLKYHPKIVHLAYFQVLGPEEKLGVIEK